MNPQANQPLVSPTTHRRTFLKNFAGSAAALSVFPALGSADSSNEFARIHGRLAVPDTVDESFWRVVKEQFTIKPKLIMLNAANLCPSPHTVSDTVSRLTSDLDSDVSFQNRAKFDQ